MPDHRKPPIAAKPSRSIFDPFNSSATGHQRADNRLSGSTSWRDSRSRKLQEQFKAGNGGGQRMSDIVGAGSPDFGQDGRTSTGGWIKGAKGLRENGQQSMLDVGFTLKKSSDHLPERKPTKVVNPFTPFIRDDGMLRESSWTSRNHPSATDDNTIDDLTEASLSTDMELSHKDRNAISHRPRRIFDSLVIYLNGSTAPVISDHKVKRLLSENGARLSIALGRRSVTHVIIGKTNGNGGVGGGLAGSKMQKEITRLRGNGVKYVSVEWVIESIKAGIRLPESRFEALRLAPHGVDSVASFFKDQKKQQSFECG